MRGVLGVSGAGESEKKTKQNCKQQGATMQCVTQEGQ